MVRLFWTLVIAAPAVTSSFWEESDPPVILQKVDNGRRSATLLRALLEEFAAFAGFHG